MAVLPYARARSRVYLTARAQSPCRTDNRIILNSLRERFAYAPRGGTPLPAPAADGLVC